MHPGRPSRRTLTAVVVGVTFGVLTTAAFVPSAGAAGATARYQVRRGDTLSGIALALHVSTASLIDRNGIADANRVYAGTWLQVPDGGEASGGGATATFGTRHVVRLGETLSHIAARYGLSTSVLAQANGITDLNLVVVGAPLVVPAGRSGSSRTTFDPGSSAGSSGAASLPLRLRRSPSRLALMPVFDHWAAQYGVPPDLLKAVTWLESGWQQGVVSSTGAVGIGQLMPVTSAFVSEMIGVRLDPRIPEQNIRMSARYLRWLLDITGGSAARTLAGYYQGLASVFRHGLYPSTLAYVDGVLALRHRF